MVRDAERRRKSVSFGEEEIISGDDPSSSDTSDTVTGPAELTGSDQRRAQRKANPSWADSHKELLRSVEENLEKASRDPILSGIISEKWGNRARKSHSGRRKGAFLRVQLVGPKEQVF